jgi:hypothetical protein
MAGQDLPLKKRGPGGDGQAEDKQQRERLKPVSFHEIGLEPAT